MMLKEFKTFKELRQFQKDGANQVFHVCCKCFTLLA